jgi:hypothetical protein
MSTPSDPNNDSSAEGVNLEKGKPVAEEPFDPYRFGKPEHPIPAEYAPPGYTGPTIPAGSSGNPYQPPNPWAAQPPYPPAQQNPFNNPPGTPYPPHPGQQQPYQYPPPNSPFGQAPGPGAPPPPPYHGYVQPKAGNGKAVAALVFGVLSIVLCWLSFFDAIFVVLGLVFGLIALSEAKRPGAGGRSMAISGLVCTVVGAILATVLTVVLVHAINKCGGMNARNDPGFSDCVRHHF